MRRTTKQNDGADLAEKEQLTASATERAALAAVLDDPQKALPLALRYGVTGEDFTDKARGLAFDAALALFAEGGGVDPLTVADRLIQQGDAEGAAAAEDAQAVALDAAERGRPVAVHAEDYLRIVGRRAQKRRLSSVGARLGLEAVRPESDPATLAAEAVGNLSRIVSASKGERTPGEIVGDLVQEWIDVADGKREARGVPAPSAGMAEALGRLEPGLHVLAGKTSAGKSIVEGAVARHVALSGGRVLRCSLDMSAGDLLARDLAALCWLHLPRIKKEKNVLIDERAFLPLAVKAYAGLPFTVCENADLPEIVARARALKADGGLALVTVDFVQNVNTGNPKLDASGNANEKINAVTKALKRFANDEGLPVLLVSQLNRAQRDEKQAPVLADLRDSGAIEQDARTVSFLYPEATQAPATPEGWRMRNIRHIWYSVAKNQQGTLGRAPLRMRCDVFSLEDAARPEGDADGREVAPWWDSSAPPTADYPAPVIAAGGRGLFGAFDPRFLERINAEADAAGVARWETVETIQGGLAKVGDRLADYRRGRV